MTENWLIDKSAFVRLAQSPDRDQWANRISRGLVKVSSLTLMEIGYSARRSDLWQRELSRGLLAAMPTVYLTPAIEDYAISILSKLMEFGEHRAPSLADLMLAAIAENEKLTLLHVDKDFELIAAHTQLKTERLRFEA